MSASDGFMLEELSDIKGHIALYGADPSLFTTDELSTIEVC